VSYTYDAKSRVTSITNANSTITRTYYGDDLLNSETNTYGDGIARTVTYTYDPKDVGVKSSRMTLAGSLDRLR
jgi:hypothetical protein